MNSSAWAAGEPGAATIVIDGGSYLYRNLVVSGLPAGLSARLEGDRVSISGTPTWAGTYSGIGVSLQDSRGTTVRATYSLTVNLGLTPTLSAARAGLSYSASIRATGGSGSYSYAVTSGSLPTGFNLSSTGRLSGTATRAGTYTFSVRAADTLSPGLSRTRSYTLTVTPAAASTVQISTSTASTTTYGRVSVTVTVSDRFGNVVPYNGDVTISSSNAQVFSSLRITVANGSGSGTLIASHSGTATISTTVDSIRSNGVTIAVSPSMYYYSYELAARFTNGATRTTTRQYTLSTDGAADRQAGLDADAWRIALARTYNDAWVSVTSRRMSKTAAN